MLGRQNRAGGQNWVARAENAGYGAGLALPSVHHRRIHLMGAARGRYGETRLAWTPAAGGLSDMFEQVAPFRGYIRQQTACGRLGITPSLAEECCGPRLVEGDTGPRAVP